jgi:hypothetical protein
MLILWFIICSDWLIRRTFVRVGCVHAELPPAWWILILHSKINITSWCYSHRVYMEGKPHCKWSSNRTNTSNLWNILYLVKSHWNYNHDQSIPNCPHPGSRLKRWPACSSSFSKQRLQNCSRGQKRQGIRQYGWASLPTKWLFQSKLHRQRLFETKELTGCPKCSHL